MIPITVPSVGATTTTTTQAPVGTPLPVPELQIPRCHMYESMGLTFISNPNDCVK